MCAASHLWWSTEARGREGEDVKELYRDGKRVLECLQRALRVADACMDAAVSVELFVEILNQYVYYFDQENDAVCFSPSLFPSSPSFHHSSSDLLQGKCIVLTIAGHDKIHQRPH